MKRLRPRDQHDIEGQLRRHRPEPRTAFVQELSGALRERTRRPTTPRRAVLVAILTVAMLTIFATFGGIGYASTAAGDAIQLSSIERLVGISPTTQSTVVPTGSSGSDQYRPGKGCGDTNHIHTGSGGC